MGTETQAIAILEKLWPFIRHWPMAGAAPEASDAVMDTARLLGKHAEIQKESNAEQLTEAYNEGMADQTATALEALDELSLPSKVGPTLAQKIIEAVRGDDDLD